MNNLIKTHLKNSFLAGFMIALGGWIFLSVQGGVIGSLLFSTGLLCVCFFQFYLFTGKICYFTDNRSAANIKLLVSGLVFNLFAAALTGLVATIVKPEIKETAITIVQNKLAKTPVQVLLAGIICGVFIYIAVESWRESSSILSFVIIVLCVSGFILCGGEHCIANMFYIAVAGKGLIGKTVLFLVINIFGNSLGGIGIRMIHKVR